MVLTSSSSRPQTLRGFFACLWHCCANAVQRMNPLNKDVPANLILVLAIPIFSLNNLTQAVSLSVLL